jgi:AcrR family transcriptional regulator
MATRMPAARELRWERRPDERPHELLEAALHVFAASGYRATRLEQIAEAAGVTKGTIYHYFANKDDLFRRAVEQRRQAMFAKLADVLEWEEGPVSVRLRRAIRTGWHDVIDQDGSILRLLVGEVSVEAPELFRDWVADGIVPGWELMARAIREGQRTGEFRRDADADVAARMLASGIMMQMLLRCRGELARVDPIDQDRLIDSAIDLFLHSLRPTTVQPPAS